MDKQLQEQLLSQLKDVHTPDAVSWWPLATGWWIVLSLVVLSFVALGLLFWRRYKRNQYRKLALSELKTHFKSWQTHHNDKAYIAAANNVLKRVSRIINADSVSQFADPWVDYLESRVTVTFSQESRHALAHQCYQEHVSADINKLNTEVKQWLKSHRREVANA